MDGISAGEWWSSISMWHGWFQFISDATKWRFVHTFAFFEFGVRGDRYRTNMNSFELSST
jgi:hypothetical protein